MRPSCGRLNTRPWPTACPSCGPWTLLDSRPQFVGGEVARAPQKARAAARGPLALVVMDRNMRSASDWVRVADDQGGHFQHAGFASVVTFKKAPSCGSALFSPLSC